MIKAFRYTQPNNDGRDVIVVESDGGPTGVYVATRFSEKGEGKIVGWNLMVTTYDFLSGMDPDDVHALHPVDFEVPPSELNPEMWHPADDLAETARQDFIKYWGYEE